MPLQFGQIMKGPTFGPIEMLKRDRMDGIKAAGSVNYRPLSQLSQDQGALSHTMQAEMTGAVNQDQFQQQEGYKITAKATFDPLQRQLTRLSMDIVDLPGNYPPLANVDENIAVDDCPKVSFFSAEDDDLPEALALNLNAPESSKDFGRLSRVQQEIMRDLPGFRQQIIEHYLASPLATVPPPVQPGVRRFGVVQGGRV